MHRGANNRLESSGGNETLPARSDPIQIQLAERWIAGSRRVSWGNLYPIPVKFVRFYSCRYRQYISSLDSWKIAGNYWEITGLVRYGSWFVPIDGEIRRISHVKEIDTRIIAAFCKNTWQLASALERPVACRTLPRSACTLVTSRPNYEVYTQEERAINGSKACQVAVRRGRGTVQA
jgi:hypothetical protein